MLRMDKGEGEIGGVLSWHGFSASRAEALKVVKEQECVPRGNGSRLLSPR